MRENTEGFYSDRNMVGGPGEFMPTEGVAQAQHGSAPSIAGQDKANPASLIGSAAMLLAWLGHRHKNPAFNKAAAGIEAAVDMVLADPSTRTADLGGSLGTKAFGAAVVGHLRA